MRLLAHLFICFGVLGVLATRSPAAGMDDEFDEKRIAFEQVAVTGTPTERERALGELVGTAHPDAVGVLSGEFARVATKLRKANAELLRVRYQLERKRLLLVTLAKRAERDESLAESVTEQRERIREMG